MATTPEPTYAPYPVPTPFINQPNVPGYSTSQAIQQNNTSTYKPYVPQGFVANPYYGQGGAGSNQQFASPANVGAAQGANNMSSGQTTINPFSRMTESEALGKGLDVNQLRSQGLLNEPAPSGSKTITTADALAKGWDTNNLPSGYTIDRSAQDAQQKALYDQETGMIDNAYGDAMGIYDGIYNNRVAQKDNYLNTATSPYDAQLPLLQTQRDSALKNNSQMQNTQDMDQQNAIASARRLYSELGQGVKQRFGGTNSAGEFAQQFYGREFQKQLGDVQNTHGKNIAVLQDKAAQIDAEHQANLRQISLQRDAAKAQAQIDFQNELDKISQAKGQIAQAKADRKLQALQGYRQNLLQVDQQFNTFAQNMALQKQAQQADLEKQARALAAGYSTAPALNNYTFNPTQGISTVQSGNIDQSSLVGQIAPGTTDNRTWLQKLLSAGA